MGGAGLGSPPTARLLRPEGRPRGPARDTRALAGSFDGGRVTGLCGQGCAQDGCAGKAATPPAACIAGMPSGRGTAHQIFGQARNPWIACPCGAGQAAHPCPAAIPALSALPKVLVSSRSCLSCFACCCQMALFAPAAASWRCPCPPASRRRLSSRASFPETSFCPFRAPGLPYVSSCNYARALLSIRLLPQTRAMSWCKTTTGGTTACTTSERTNK